MTEQIFISYSKKDSEFSYKLADDLESAGFKVWIDRSIGGGEDWRKSIERNLRASGEVIIVVSPNSMTSEWVTHEGSLAYGWEKNLFPVLIEPVASLPPWLEEYQWIDFVNRSYGTAFDELVAALTPPNPIQDLLNHEVQTHKQTGVVIDEDTLRVIKNAQATLKINEEAQNLIALSDQVVEARLRRERQVQLELENARRQRERIINAVGIASLIFTVLITAASYVFGPKPTPQAPNGIVSIELAGDLNTFQAMVASWNNVNYFLAGVSLGIDFLFLMVYSTALTLGCFWAARKYRQMNQNGLAKLGTLLTYSMWLAGAFDFVENVALIFTLVRNQLLFDSQIALWAALAKFALITLGLVFILTAFLLPASRTRQQVDLKPG